MKIVLYYSHPLEPKSVLNAPLIEAARRLDNVTVRWIDELYPDFKMTAAQIKEEQTIMEEAEAIFFQFPVYWYSPPASLKSLMDHVMTYGWAFGSRSVLHGRKFRAICTCGASISSYGGEFKATDIVKPLEQSFKFCKCEPLPPYILFSDSDKSKIMDDYLALFK